MTHASTESQVALLIDFENLVRGITDDDSLDCELLFRLAEEYGRVLIANAYADWRMKDVNQYQTDLNRLGVELVHVFGRGWGAGYKNAVDVKMAVDAVTTITALPHISIFIIVSGDRDFIHVLKALRRHGKTVVGVSPKSSTSDDFAALCDRFVAYEALMGAYAASSGTSPETPGLDKVRKALVSILRGRPEGIKGAMIKPLLRRELSPSFDESVYGFARLTDLLRHLSDVAKLVIPAEGGDVLVLPASATFDEQDVATKDEPRSQRLLREAGLSFYRYEQDSDRRRSILSGLFEAMTARQPFSWEDVQQTMLAAADDAENRLSVTILNRYKTMIYQNRGFVFEPNQSDRPQRERLMRLRDDIDSADNLILLYESSVAYKIVDAAGGSGVVSPEDLAEILGLARDEEDNINYCQQLLIAAESVCSEESETSA